MDAGDVFIGELSTRFYARLPMKAVEFLKFVHRLTGVSSNELRVHFSRVRNQLVRGGYARRLF